MPEGFLNKSVEGEVLATSGGGSNLGGDMIDTKGVAKALLQYCSTDKPAEALIQGMDHGLP